MEQATGWSAKKFVTMMRRYRTIQIQAGQNTITAEDILPDDAQDALNKLRDNRQQPH